MMLLWKYKIIKFYYDIWVFLLKHFAHELYEYFDVYKE